jgi:hypothetical protein
MLKIIIIIIGYIWIISLLFFSQYYSRLLKIYIILNFENEFIFWKIKIIRFVNVETDPSLQ